LLFSKKLLLRYFPCNLEKLLETWSDGGVSLKEIAHLPYLSDNENVIFQEGLNKYAKENGKVQFCVSELQWSLAECFPKTFGDETLICMTQKEYKEYFEIGIPVIAYSSQANGVFAKAGDEGLEQVPDKLKKFVTPENIRRYSNLQRLCKKTGYSKTAVSLNYIIDNKLSAAAIIGCSKMEQLQEALSTTGITLSQQEIDSLV
jgi:aryl-alcohol dehydrogenase-like predicted oxidoreductase